MKYHPDELKQHEIIDHIRDALAEHLGVEASVTDRHTIVIHHRSPGAYDQIITIQMDVFMNDDDTRRKAKLYDQFTTSWEQMGDR